MHAPGGVGGLVQGVFMSPILLLKTRVMTNPDVRAPWGVGVIDVHHPLAAQCSYCRPRKPATAASLSLFVSVGSFGSPHKLPYG